MEQNTLMYQLEKLDSYLNIIDAPILQYLNQGIELSAEDIHMFQDEGIVFSPEVHQLYKWHNGINHSSLKTILQNSLFYGGVFLDFELAKECYLSDAGKYDWWPKHFFPLFDSGMGGEYIFIDCDINSNTYGMLFYHNYDEPEFEEILIKYDSLISLFKTINECFYNNVSYYDENGNLKDDHDKCVEVSKKHNPNAGYWSIYNEK